MKKLELYWRHCVTENLLNMKMYLMKRFDVSHVEFTKILQVNKRTFYLATYALNIGQNPYPFDIIVCEVEHEKSCYLYTGCYDE